MSEIWWIINARHEVVPVKEKDILKGEEGRHFVDGQPGWFNMGVNLFDSEEDAKLRAIERVLSYALEHGIPVREQYVRTACAYAKEFRERVRESEAEAARLRKALLKGEDVLQARAERDQAKQDAEKMAEWLDCYPGQLPQRVEEAIARHRR